MRNFVVVTLSFAGVITLLDVATSFVVNGSVDISSLLILVVASAWLAQRWTERSREAMTRDILTLLRLRYHAAALARHTQMLGKGLPE